MHYTQGGGYNAKYGYSPSESTARKTVQSCTTSHKKATAFAQAATPTPFYRANDVNTSNLEVNPYFSTITLILDFRHRI